MKSSCFKSLLILFCLSAMLFLVSCGDDDVAPGSSALELEQSSISVRIGANTSMDIVSGNGGYAATSADHQIATATISDDDRVVINGLQLGETIITVRDKANNEVTLDVMVLNLKK